MGCFRKIRVSILVLMEVPLQLYLLTFGYLFLKLVSILVLMEVPLQQVIRNKYNELSKVSILVLMEVPLQLCRFLSLLC